MSDNPWQPVHHVEADEPEETQPTPEKKEPAKGGSKAEGKGASVSLTLNLPEEFIAAVKDLAAALRENTKAMQGKTE